MRRILFCKQCFHQHWAPHRPFSLYKAVLAGRNGADLATTKALELQVFQPFQSMGLRLKRQRQK